MKTILVFAMHGAAPNDFPKNEKGEQNLSPARPGKRIMIDYGVSNLSIVVLKASKD